MMDNNADMINLKRLIHNGKNKGYITFEELNDDLSDDFVSSEEHIDELMMMFQELDIMVIDDAAKKKIEKAKGGKGEGGKSRRERECIRRSCRGSLRGR